MNTIDNEGWIHVSQLPEKRIRVLMCNKLGCVQEGFYGSQSSVSGDSKECWRGNIGPLGLEPEEKIEIVLWRPLPNPPMYLRECRHFRCWHEADGCEICIAKGRHPELVTPQAAQEHREMQAAADAHSD